ncbi:MAG: c-type cytochrome [Acidobacteria bacterium]|nr:c-type cytochrome [Acidobacteriota bacterium]
MMRSLLAAGLMCVCVMAVAVTKTSAQGGGQGGGQAAPLQNLQVLPKDMARPDVIALMRTFTVALGVQCTHCHVGTPQERFKDDLPAKATARKMLKMVMAVNADHLGVKPGEPNKATCYSCHRGALKPLTAAPAGGF